MRMRLIAPMTASALALAVVAGCGSNEPNAEAWPTAEAPGQMMPPGAMPSGDEEAAEAGLVALSEDEIETIRQLPEEDAELALAQKVCPVSDEPLGSMGVPIKLDVQGRAVFICCAGCKGPVEDDPEAILAKLPAR